VCGHFPAIATHYAIGVGSSKILHGNNCPTTLAYPNHVCFRIERSTIQRYSALVHTAEPDRVDAEPQLKVKAEEQAKERQLGEKLVDLWWWLGVVVVHKR
jgi:hypothetical protein